MKEIYENSIDWNRDTAKLRVALLSESYMDFENAAVSIFENCGHSKANLADTKISSIDFHHFTEFFIRSIHDGYL
jgi:hypothetical protein